MSQKLFLIAKNIYTSSIRNNALHNLTLNKMNVAGFVGTGV